MLERMADQAEQIASVVPRVMSLLDQAEALMALGPRLVALLDGAEAEVSHVSRTVDSVDVVTAAAAGEVLQVGSVVRQAQVTADQTDLVVTQAQALVDRLRPLLDRLEPPLTKLQPTLEVLADTTDPEEVAALVRMVDHLPELTRRLEHDVLPMMGTLSTVAPDLHDLLAVSSELNEIIGKLPGFGRIKRRVEDEQEQEAAENPPPAADGAST